MKKELGSKWYFPFGKDLGKVGANNSSLEHFNDNLIKSLAREICQNSLDAIDDESKPVEVTFDEKMISTSQIPNKEQFLNEIIPRAKKTWSEDKDVKRFLKFCEIAFKKDEISVLKISDYNTTGLIDGHWEALIEYSGSSVKKDDTSAGSFGIGKAAPFANSVPRMIFYNTKLINGKKKSIGVSNFVSFDNKDGTTSQNIGYYGKDGKVPFDDFINFGFEERKEAGTDIFIIGFKKNAKKCLEDEWIEELKSEILEQFMMSIYLEKLIVKIKDKEINKENMREMILSLNHSKHEKLINYFSVLIDPNRLEINLDERFERYGFKFTDGKLILSKRNNKSMIIKTKSANRKILITRIAGMKIKERDQISNNIQFNGIFIAKGAKFNNILKQMENPNHNDFIADRLKDIYLEDPTLGKDLLDDMYYFMKENVKNNYENKIEESVDAFGISDFLPNRISNKFKDEGSSLEKESLSVNKIEIKMNEHKEDYESDMDKLNQEHLNELEKSGVAKGEGFFGGEGTTGDGNHSKNGKRGDEGANPLIDGYNKPDDNSQKILQKKEKEFKKLKFRVLEEDYTKGLYKIVINTNEEIKELRIEIKVVGENGSKYGERILDAVYLNNKVKTIDNNIYISNLEKNSKILFKIPFKKRVKMEVKFYETK